jgi:hypothetical protein
LFCRLRCWLSRWLSRRFTTRLCRWLSGRCTTRLCRWLGRGLSGWLSSRCTTRLCRWLSSGIFWSKECSYFMIAFVYDIEFTRRISCDGIWSTHRTGRGKNRIHRRTTYTNDIGIRNNGDDIVHSINLTNTISGRICEIEISIRISPNTIWIDHGRS